MELNITGCAEDTVTENNTAKAVGSGSLMVYATPSLAALIEKAACNCVAEYLEEGTTSVGTDLSIKHLAATPVGMKVKAEAKLIEIDGRKLTFEVKASDECDVISTGTHERFIVKSDRFMEKTNSKMSAKE